MVERWVLGGQTVVVGYVLWYDMLYIRMYGCSSHSHSYRTCLRTLLLHIILLCPFSDNPSKMKISNLTENPIT